MRQDLSEELMMKRCKSIDVPDSKTDSSPSKKLISSATSILGAT